MPLMQWSPHLSVGVEFMDADHQRMMAAINELHDVTTAQRMDEVPAALDALIEVTRTHFEGEERSMRTHDYRWYRQHKRAHEALLEELTEFRERTAAGDMQLGGELTHFLDEWLISHILESDKHLGGFLEGVAARP